MTMTRSTYAREDLGREIEAPSGYYQPMEEAWLEVQGRKVLYVLGMACIEASCCGVGSWSYLRVEGYTAEDDPIPKLQERGRFSIDTVEERGERKAIITLLRERHPGVRIEFR
jgi:hypothetical protein